MVSLSNHEGRTIQLGKPYNVGGPLLTHPFNERTSHDRNQNHPLYNYINSALFPASLVFVFLPWNMLNAFLGWVGPFAYPDEPIVRYSSRPCWSPFSGSAFSLSRPFRRPRNNNLSC